MSGVVNRQSKVNRWGRWARYLVPVVYIGCLGALFADMTQEIFYVSFGILYIPLVCTAVFHRDPRGVWWLACGATTMAMIGFFFPAITPNPTEGLINHGLSVAAIFITASLVRYARSIHDQLAAQTTRAEEAERVKTDVLTTLSQELRSPLQTMVGLSEVMISGCRPDQRMPLQQVQGGSKRLLATIENLIDLTNVEERPLTSKPVDVNQMIRQTADANRFLASERQISVELDLSGAAPTASADAWAVRRILDNLIANAVKFSPPGSTVELATECNPDSVALLVRDAGIGMPADILRRLGEPFFRDDTTLAISGTGTGLALSRRLARAMGAELEFDSEQGCGTTAILRLPI